MRFRGGLLHVCLKFNERLVSPNLHLHHIFSCLFPRQFVYLFICSPGIPMAYWAPWCYLTASEALIIKEFFSSVHPESFLLESFLLISHQSHFVFALWQLFDYQIHTVNLKNFRICVLFRNVHSVLLLFLFFCWGFPLGFVLIKNTIMLTHWGQLKNLTKSLFLSSKIRFISRSDSITFM